MVHSYFGKNVLQNISKRENIINNTVKVDVDLLIYSYVFYSYGAVTI